MKQLFFFMTILWSFIIGCYFASEFKFNEPIPAIKWIMVIILFLSGVVLFLTSNTKNK